jgi:hypothetical protein
MITVVIILALLTLDVVTDRIPGEGHSSAVEFDDDRPRIAISTGTTSASVPRDLHPKARS